MGERPDKTHGIRSPSTDELDHFSITRCSAHWVLGDESRVAGCEKLGAVDFERLDGVLRVTPVDVFSALQIYSDHGFQGGHGAPACPGVAEGIQ